MCACGEVCIPESIEGPVFSAGISACRAVESGFYILLFIVIIIIIIGNALKAEFEEYKIHPVTATSSKTQTCCC